MAKEQVSWRGRREDEKRYRFRAIFKRKSSVWREFPFSLLSLDLSYLCPPLGSQLLPSFVSPYSRALSPIFNCYSFLLSAFFSVSPFRVLFIFRVLLFCISFWTGSPPTLLSFKELYKPPPSLRFYSAPFSSNFIDNLSRWTLVNLPTILRSFHRSSFSFLSTIYRLHRAANQLATFENFQFFPSKLFEFLIRENWFYRTVYFFMIPFDKYNF